MRVNEVSATVTVFCSIRDTSRKLGLSEYFLRKMLKKGKLPGVYSGRKFLVNIPSLLELLSSMEEGKTDEC